MSMISPDPEAAAKLRKILPRVLSEPDISLRRDAKYRSISTRYWLIISLLLGLLLVGAGASDIWFAYRENIERISQIQRAEAKAADGRILDYLRDIETQIKDVAQIAWIPALTDQDRLDEFHRLLKIVPAILELRSIGPNLAELLYVSRVKPDRVNSNLDLASDVAPILNGDTPVAYGATYFRGISEPYLTLAVRFGASPSQQIVLAELNLKFVTDVIRELEIGKTGKAYVIDRNNRLIAHPNLSLVLANTDLSTLPQVKSVRAALAKPQAGPLPTVWARSPEGEDVLTSAVSVPSADWLIFVEQPRREVLEPVTASVYRSVVVFLIGLAVAFAASRLLARALTRPILQLRQGAARLAGGDLDARINVRTGDEVEALAEGFNQMAAKLKESYAGLEAKVESRTRELAATRDQVQQQAQELEVLNAELTERVDELGLRKEEAERANAAKTRFLASASHDLRQPMHTIGLLVGILRDRTRNDESRDLATKVEASVGVMQNLFSSLLDISKLDAGAIKPNIVDFRIDDMLMRIDANYGPQANERGLTLKVVPSRATIRSDPVLLERILGNLVTNAIRYTRQGRILVGCRRRSERLRILVFDTGIGIAAGDLEIVFEEFVQLANPERDRTKGLGLGLSIVKRSADLLGQAMIVRSTLGKGSVFGIEVPIVTQLPMPTVTDAEAPETGASPLQGAFVVVIDDDQESRFAMESLCRHWGCHVAGAGSPDDALRILDDHLRAPDLIITDYRLRDGKTGMDVIVQVRKQSEQNVPAIVVTGDISAPELENVRMTGIALLHKPVDVETLRKAAEGMLGSHLAAPLDCGKRPA
jgi:signal transduction histidine kinase